MNDEPIYWRSPTPPYNHQLAAAKWRRGSHGSVHPSALLEMGLGTGKSLTAINEMLMLLAHRPTAQILVLCGAALRRTVWAEQLAQHAPSLSFTILDGPRTQRRELLEADRAELARVWVHSHEDLPSFGRVLSQYHWDMIVIDECAGFRTASAARTKLLTNYNQPRLDADFKLALSGLPMIKNVADLYPILRWLGAFMVQRENGSWKPGNKAEFIDRFLVVDGRNQELVVKDPAGLNALLESCRFQVPKNAVMDIPRSWRYDRVRLPDWQRKSYNSIRRELKVRFTDPTSGHVAESEISSRLTELLRLAQVTAGFEAVNTEEWLWHDDNAKTRHLIDNVMPELSEEKVIIWCVFQVEAQNVHRLLRAQGHRAIAYYGGGAQRDKLNQTGYQLWKQGKADVFVSTLAKGSKGLNLPEASATVYHSRSYSTEQFIQSLDRNYRATTRHQHLNVIVLEGENTIDEQVSEVLGNDARKAASWTSLDLAQVLGARSDV